MPAVCRVLVLGSGGTGGDAVELARSSAGNGGLCPWPLPAHGGRRRWQPSSCHRRVFLGTVRD